MRRAVHAKFGRGVVLEEDRSGGETFFVVDFPELGRKKLAARFVQLEDAPDPEAPAPEPDVRSAEHEAACARTGVDAFRAYGQWLVEQGEEHGELILLECDPPSGLSPRAEREAHARDVKRLTRRALAPLRRLLPDNRAEYTLKHGFVSVLNVLVASANELVVIVRALHHARVTSMIESLLLPPPSDGGDLTPLWKAWAALPPFPRLRGLSLPSPGARGGELALLLAPLTVLAVKQGRELRLPPLPRATMLTIEDASPECIVDIAEGAPNLRWLSLPGPGLHGDMLRELVARRAAFAHVQLTVSAQSVQGFGAEDMHALRRAFPKATLVLPDLPDRPPTKKAPRKPDPPVDLEAAMIDGEPRPLRRILAAMRGKEGALVVRDARRKLRAITAEDDADDSLVTVVHPIDLTETERGYFAREVSAQPIEQLARAVHHIAPHRAPLTVHPFDVLPSRAVRALWGRGWEPEFDDDETAHDAMAYATERSFSQLSIAASAPHRPLYRDRAAEVLEPIDVDPSHEGLLFLGAEREPVPLGTVPARIFSEVMRDLVAVKPAPPKKAPTATTKRPIWRVDRLFDRLAKAADDVDVRADTNAAVARLSPEGQRLVMLILQGKMPTDDAVARTLRITPEAAEALLDDVENALAVAT